MKKTGVSEIYLRISAPHEVVPIGWGLSILFLSIRSYLPYVCAYWSANTDASIGEGRFLVRPYFVFKHIWYYRF